MKFQVSMKCPDALDYAIEEAVRYKIGPLDTEEKEMEFDELVEQTKELTERWFEYGEYITLTIDTEKETCIVNE